MSTIPIRYDIEMTDPAHSKVKLLNNCIKELASRFDSVYIINTDHLQKRHHTKNVFHLNNNGKVKLSLIILETLEAIFF